MSNTESSSKATNFRLVIFSMACGTSWLLYFHRYVFALIKPELIEEWGLTKTQLGMLDGGFAMFYTGLQIPIGLAADLLGVHFVLTVLGIVGSIGLALHAWAPSADELWYARALLGGGQSAVFACLSRVTRTWFPASQRTTVQGWVGVFFGRIGGVSCNLIVGSFLFGVCDFGWRSVVYAMAGLGIFQALLFCYLFRNSPAKHPSVNETELSLIEGDSTPDERAAETKMNVEPAAKLTFRQMFRQSSFRSIINLIFLNIQTILSTLADNVFSAWIPLFLAEFHGLNFKEMGIYSALPLLGGAIGGAIGGWLNDKMISATGSRRWSRSLVGFCGKGMASFLLLMSFFYFEDPQKFCIMLFFVKLFSDSSLTTTWGVVTDIGGTKSATVFAYNNSVAGIGSIVAPILYGFISQVYGWVPVFETACITYFVCACSWLLINCTIPIIEEDSPEEPDAESPANDA
jgi:MFS transporter, ACS family, glucarate transporter